VDKQTDLISRLQDEADLCRNDGATDIAALLDDAVEALRDRNHDTAAGEKWRTDSRLEEWFPLTAERLAALEAENAALKREAHEWWTAARDATKAETERCALVAALHSQYPVTTDYDRGYAKARADAAAAIRRAPNARGNAPGTARTD
jgi:hypothetical protein